MKILKNDFMIKRWDKDNNIRYIFPKKFTKIIVCFQITSYLMFYWTDFKYGGTKRNIRQVN